MNNITETKTKMDNKMNKIIIEKAIQHKRVGAWYVSRITYGIKGYGKYIDVFSKKKTVLYHLLIVSNIPKYIVVL